MKFLRNSMLALLALATHVHAGNGVWSSSGPYGGVVYDVQLDPSNEFTMYASTRGGLFKSVDGASSWSRIESGLANSVPGTPFALDRDAVDVVRSGRTRIALPLVR